jgi:hypothetical protein
MGISTKGSRKELENRIGKYNGEAASLARQKAELELTSLRTSIANAQKGTDENAFDMSQIAALFGDDQTSITPTAIPQNYQSAYNTYQIMMSNPALIANRQIDEEQYKTGAEAYFKTL